MSVLKDGDSARLRLGGVAGTEISVSLPNGEQRIIRRKPGVLIFDRIPRGALAIARVVRPASLQEADAAFDAADGTAVPAQQGFRFEIAPRPGVFSVNGSAPFNTAITPSALGRVSQGGLKVYQVDPTIINAGVLSLVQHSIPAWAAFAPVREGSLVPSGKAPALDLATPNVVERDRDLVRCRWTGTAETGETIANPAGETLIVAGGWANNHANLVPGSIVITLPTSGNTMVDDGFGNLASPQGDFGVIDYVTGAFIIVAAAAETGAVNADYERDCLYAPLDVDIEWDALMAAN